VTKELRVDRYRISDIIIRYIDDEFFVNRRYQRKLVWSLDEKRLLIDSILRQIPLPAIMLVGFKVPVDNGTKEILEIVDGLQRLNAIIEFVMGKYGVEYQGKICYFDPLTFNETFQLCQDGKIAKQELTLPKEICRDFINYELPAIITGQDDKAIETIFSRINSTGRKISPQDLRQSKAIGEFPDLVRRIASRVRGDYTYDNRVCLSDVPKISIGSSKYGYGIDVSTVFWRKHDLVTERNLKDSKDEEIIESLLASTLLGNKFKKSKIFLDDLYDRETELGRCIEQEVANVGKEKLENNFANVFNTIDAIFTESNTDFSTLMFESKRISNKDECFKIVFRAFYKLMSEGYVVTDYCTVASELKKARSIFDRFITKDRVNFSEAEDTIVSLYKILKPSFSKMISRSVSDLEKEIDKRLSYSKIESQLTEFKIGVSIHSSNKICSQCIHKIAKTLVAMANISNAKELGMVIVGIADSNEAYKDWKANYNGTADIISNHYVTGIEDEAKKLTGSTDNLYRQIRQCIDKEPITDKLKNYVLETFEVINYHDKELLIFYSKNVDEISLYDGEKYVRHANETVLVK
jgi:hypothetical protein